jgi:hypothetical protein
VVVVQEDLGQMHREQILVTLVLVVVLLLSQECF